MRAVCSVGGKYPGLIPDGLYPQCCSRLGRAVEFADITALPTQFICLRTGDTSSAEAQLKPLKLSKAVS